VARSWQKPKQTCPWHRGRGDTVAGRAARGALCLPSDAGGSHPYVAFFRLRHPSRLRAVRTRHPLTSARLREMTEQRSAGTDGDTITQPLDGQAFRVFDDASALVNLHVVRHRSTSTGDAPSCGLDPRVCSRREPFRLPQRAGRALRRIMCLFGWVFQEGGNRPSKTVKHLDCEKKPGLR
jgi:hypothetical protein